MLLQPSAWTPLRIGVQGGERLDGPIDVEHVQEDAVNLSADYRVWSAKTGRANAKARQAPDPGQLDRISKQQEEVGEPAAHGLSRQWTWKEYHSSVLGELRPGVIIDAASLIAEVDEDHPGRIHAQGLFAEEWTDIDVDKAARRVDAA